MHALVFLLACPSEPGDTGKDPESPVDSGDSGDSGAAGNTAPGAPVVAISPASPNEASDLAVTIVTESVDAEADAVSYRYAWSVNGTAAADISGATVPADRTTDGDTWTVEVYPNDGLLEGSPGTSTVTIANAPPVAPTIHIDPPAPAPGDALTLVFDTPATDANGDALTQIITWYEDGARSLSWDGLTTIEGMYVDGGEHFRAVVTVTDGYSDVLTVEAEVTVANTPPEISSVTISPSDPTDSDDLTCTVRASDEDGEDPETGYRWFRDGVEATEVGNSDTVPSDLTTIGESWECQGEATDGVDTVTLLSDAEVVRGFWGYRMRGEITVNITEDTAGTPSGTGEGTWEVYSSGGRYNDNDCEVVWSLIATENTGLCRGCEYAFDAEWTYDSAASTITTGCSAMTTDSSGSITVRTGPAISAYWDDASVSTYSYYYRELSLSARGTGGRFGGYYGRYYGYYYAVDETTDTAGNVTLTAYTDHFIYY
ncbi:MAG: hypothetical protein FJ090_07220 [Deltaproteobacteria bacterium]|nr:hypothetical protein [Deltaproteobacteria bacterium]